MNVVKLGTTQEMAITAVSLEIQMISKLLIRVGIMIRKQNRLRVKKAKKDYHWCGCDRMMVSPGEKCKFCGKIASKGKRKFKKDVDLTLEDVL